LLFLYLDDNLILVVIQFLKMDIEIICILCYTSLSYEVDMDNKKLNNITDKELQAFFVAMQKNGLSYRKKPRTREECERIVCVYNRIDNTYYFVDKNTELAANEEIVTSQDIFSKIASSKNYVISEVDNVM